MSPIFSTKYNFCLCVQKKIVFEGWRFDSDFNTVPESIWKETINLFALFICKNGEATVYSQNQVREKKRE